MKGKQSMWIFTTTGFFSAVQNFDDKNLIHVRARFKGDLERLCKKYNVAPQISYTPDNDYPYRMNFERNLWADIMRKEAESIDYCNFKNKVHTVKDDPNREVRSQAYMDVWAALKYPGERY